MDVKEDRRGEGEGDKFPKEGEAMTYYQLLRCVDVELTARDRNKEFANSENSNTAWTEAEEVERETLEWFLYELERMKR